jgi:predicted transcriptional regulator of viral defense system
MHDRPGPDLRGLEAEAYAQNGYFTTSQARAHSVSLELLKHHERAGRFDRIRRGLYRLHGYPSAEHDDMREKWIALGRDKAVLSHQSALSLLDLSDTIPDEVHLLVPRRYRGLRRPPGVALHTRLDDDQPPTVWREGLPVTAPARTLVDVIDELQPEQFAIAVRQAVERGLLTPGQLRAEAARRRKEHAIGSLFATAGIDQ